MATKSDSCDWISIQIKQGNATIVHPTVVFSTSEDTFGSILGKVPVSNVEMESVETVRICATCQSHIVPLNAPVNTVRMHVYCIEYDYNMVPLDYSQNRIWPSRVGVVWPTCILFILSRGLTHVL